MVRLQPENECQHIDCLGHISTPPNTYGGMICQCRCHFKERELETQLALAREGLKDIAVLISDAYYAKGTIEEAVAIAQQTLAKL